MESPDGIYPIQLDALKKVVADKDDSDIIPRVDATSKEQEYKVFSMQWVNGEWKLFGVVSIMGVGLTLFV